ncbi:MAG: T9SS type A sorting domain-containing protein, partial [Bacteroidota bacterium]
PPNGLWIFCNNDYQVTIPTADQVVPLGTTLVKAQVLCPAMTVTIGTPQLRRCFNNNYYYVNYCNQGTAAASNAYVLVELDDFLSAVSATIPYTTVGTHTLRFDLGDVPVGACGSFSIEVGVNCNAALGQTHCTEAHIYPDSLCTQPSALWSGALLDLHAHCAGDSLHFVIKNIGAANLSESLDYIVIEDHVMLMMANIGFLASGDSVTVSVPANGSTWRVESQQAAYAPMLHQLGLSVEGCINGGSFSSGYVNQYQNGSDDPWVDTDCTTNTGSYDPNDKQGIPLGYGPQHFIRPGTEIEYMIRFQNTGTDTAFNIVVLDTLSAALDPRTIQVGPSSHPYRWDVFGPGVLRFKFENIQLPDSNKNEAASHGFVKFSIKPKADAPLGTVIRNTGAIYFDFNAPVITNTTDHILAENFIVTASWQPISPLLQLSIAPNPFDVETRFEIKGLTNPAPLELRVYDLQGRVMRTMYVEGPVFTLKKQDLKAGTYLFRLGQEGKMVGSGKLVVAAKP